MSIRVGVVGYGLSATIFHLPFLLDNPDYTLKGIVARGASALKASAAHPDVTIVSSLADLLLLPIDLLILSTPPETHFSMAHEALLAGKHVVIEKPMCASSAQAKELAELAERQGRVLAVYQNRRFDGDFITAQEVLRAGHVGQVREVEMHFDRFRLELKDGGKSWKEQGDRQQAIGILFDLGSHLLDQALFLFGNPPSISSSIFRQRPGSAIDDAFHLVLSYPSSSLTVSLKAGMLVAAPRPRFAFYGDQGAFVKYGLDVQEPQLRAGMGLNDAKFGIEEDQFMGTLTLVENGKLIEKKIPTHHGNYREYFRQLAAAILDIQKGERGEKGKGERVAPPVDGHSGAAVIRAIELAYLSHELKRPVDWDHPL